MKISLKQCSPISLMCAGSLLASVTVSSVAAGTAPDDPDTFLTFLERHTPEDATTQNAYYDAVDPDGKKTIYADWLFEAGFIDDPADYNSTGSLVENADAAVIYQNVTDLGFIRRVRARCEPSCNDSNPDIYALIENYGNFDDAVNRTGRIASVTMEWTSAADGSDPSSKLVTFYAYTGADSRDQTPGVPFQPNLDDRGGKAIPGLCNSCHGGAPQELNGDGAYPDNGNTGALFLPSDLDNFAFDPDRPELSRAAQESEFKKMNEITLITHRGKEKFDEVAGIDRVPGGHELIEGWYGGPGMPNPTFDGEFVPAGWLPPAAPVGVDELYLSAVAPACRACHAQQDRALDFATYEGFIVFEDAHKDLVLSIECGLDDDPADRANGSDDQAVMPLAKQTYELFWETDQVEVFKDYLGEVDCNNL